MITAKRGGGYEALLRFGYIWFFQERIIIEADLAIRGGGRKRLGFQTPWSTTIGIFIRHVKKKRIFRISKNSEIVRHRALRDGVSEG